MRNQCILPKLQSLKLLVMWARSFPKINTLGWLHFTSTGHPTEYKMFTDSSPGVVYNYWKNCYYNQGLNDAFHKLVHLGLHREGSRSILCMFPISRKITPYVAGRRPRFARLSYNCTAFLLYSRIDGMQCGSTFALIQEYKNITLGLYNLNTDVHCLF